MIKITDDELLQFAIQNDIINISTVQSEYEMYEKKKYLSKHTHKIWEGNNGKFYTYLTVGDGRKLIKRSTYEEIEDYIIDYYKGKNDYVSLEDVFNMWNDNRVELCKITQSTHIRNRQAFYRFCSEFGKYDVELLTPIMLEDFLDGLLVNHDLTAKTFGGIKSILKNTLKRAKKYGYINFNVESAFADMDFSGNNFKRRVKDPEEDVFNEEEYPIMMNYLLDNIDNVNLVIILMFVTGIRIGEAVTLRYEDFTEKMMFNVCRTESRFENEDGISYLDVKEFPKTAAGVRNVIIPSDFCWIYDKMKQYNNNDGYIFIKDNKRMSTATVRRRMIKICKKLGLKPKSPHKARKTYGSILLDNKIDSNLIINQMGHTDILCTENYYHKDRKSIEKKQQILSNISEFSIGTVARKNR